MFSTMLAYIEVSEARIVPSVYILYYVSYYSTLYYFKYSIVKNIKSIVT